jgi:Family of unknown function (DUF6496)
MPETETVKRAGRDLEEGKSPSTAAGEFVREEIDHVREGKHGARSPQQAIAIGLSKARRAGVPLPPPKKGTVKESTRKNAERAYEAGQSGERPATSRASERVLQEEPRTTISSTALSRQARAASRKRSPDDRHAAAVEGGETKRQAGRSKAVKKAAKTRAQHSAA